DRWRPHKPGLRFSPSIFIVQNERADGPSGGFAMKLVLSMLLAVSVAGCIGYGDGSNEETGEEPTAAPAAEPPMLGVFRTRDAVEQEQREPEQADVQRHLRHGGSPDMVFHNGKIMTGAITKAIFWGKSWATY